MCILLVGNGEQGTPTKQRRQKMKKIQVGESYSARSVCDYDCIFSIKVIARTAKMATIKTIHGDIKKTKIHFDEMTAREYIIPDRYSMAPVFYA